MWNFFFKNNTSVFLKNICIATQSKPHHTVFSRCGSSVLFGSLQFLPPLDGNRDSIDTTKTFNVEIL